MSFERAELQSQHKTEFLRNRLVNAMSLSLQPVKWEKIVHPL